MSARFGQTIDLNAGGMISNPNHLHHSGRRIMSVTAKLFVHGRSQAVCLPKEFRFEGTEVRISRAGDKVILEPLKKPLPIDLDAWFARLDELGARSCRTAYPTTRRSNPIRAFSSKNDLSRRSIAVGIDR
jgi:antitoxin VapB